MTLLEELHRECAPLMAEIGEKNHVRVVVHRSRQVGRRWGWDGGTLVGDSGGFPLLPQLAMMDSVRMLAGRRPKWLAEAIRLTGGELCSVTPNLRTTVGIDYAATQLGGVASATVAKNIALSNNTDAVVATDTATNVTAGTGINWGTANATDAAASNSRGEYTALGVARAAATYAHTNGVANYTQSKTFTATGACTALQACGMFDSLTQGAGTLFVENTFTATSLATNDQLTITWTINI
jgi:hypothetical protein